MPVLVLPDIFRSNRSFGAKIGYLIILFLFFTGTWISLYVNIFFTIKSLAFESGLSDRPITVNVSGESMMPAVTDGSTVELHSPKKFKIERGDIVSFQNIETGSLHYLKRIVGLPKEKVSIKSGHVFINDRALRENYLPDDLPTFGNSYIPECQQFTVPDNQYLALGDNRTVSMDSRIIGFVDKNSIDGVIKENISDKFLDYAAQNKILKVNIDENILLEKLDGKRKNEGKQPLILNPVLNTVAGIRAESIKDNFNDWKTQAETMEKILDTNQYKYNSVHEMVTFGYLDETSVVGQILDSSVDEIYFLSDNYKEIGIGQKEITTGDCTFPVISVIISWPTLPTY